MLVNFIRYHAILIYGIKIKMNIRDRIKNFIEKIKKWFNSHPFVSSVFASMLSSIILGVIGFIFAHNVTEQLNSLIVNMSDMKVSVAELESRMTSIEGDDNTNIEGNDNISIDGNDNNINGRDGIINNGDGTTIHIGDVYYYKGSELDKNFQNSMQKMFYNDKSIFSDTVGYSFADDTSVATESKTGRLVTVSDIQNNTIILHYTDNGDDVFFKGQIDANGCWDGNCVINRYTNNKLITIMDAIYDSGILKSYKQVFSYSKIYNDETYNIWAYSNRFVDQVGSKGYTWTYFKYNDYFMNFDLDDVRYDDIISADTFKQENLLDVEGYYNGYISDGNYNDDTGDAYMIKFFKPGILKGNGDLPVIRMLYKGKFVNGQPEDNSSNAWYIVRELNTKYMYYRGCFANGTANHISKNETFINNLTHEQIDEYLNQYGFQQYSDQFVTEYENQ